MKTNRSIILIATLIVLGAIVLALQAVFGGTYSIPSRPSSQNPGSGVCTLDAKLCPDGSYVGRVPPNCDFAMCPAGKDIPSSSASSGSVATFEVGIGEQGNGLGVAVSPKEVTSDSRCAVGVQCVWAGTVTVKTGLSYGTTTDVEEILTINTPVTIGDRTVTLMRVLPVKQSGVNIPAANYKFIFKVEYKK